MKGALVQGLAKESPTALDLRFVKRGPSHWNKKKKMKKKEREISGGEDKSTLFQELVGKKSLHCRPESKRLICWHFPLGEIQKLNGEVRLEGALSESVLENALKTENQADYIRRWLRERSLRLDVRYVAPLREGRRLLLNWRKKRRNKGS